LCSSGSFLFLLSTGVCSVQPTGFEPAIILYNVLYVGGVSIKLFDIPPMNWKDTQLIYHAIARMNEECLILTSTKEPYACIGFAGDLEKELDLSYCKDNNIGYFRRETGGGTVYLDKDQLFFQLILKRDNPLSPRFQEAFFKRFLEPVVHTLNSFGIEGKFVPLNDLVVNDKKISGNGGGEIGECKVLIGNLLLDFDFETMASILNVPNEGFRNMVLNGMKQNMTTIKGELGEVPSQKDLKKSIIEEYEKLLGPLTPQEPNDEVHKLMKEIEEEFSTEKWLFQRVPKKEGRDVKIREGIMIVNRTFKDVDWSVELNFELENNTIMDLQIINAIDHGFSYNALITSMFGRIFAEKEVLNTLKELYETGK
jgi:lipoate-protein ligase A